MKITKLTVNGQRQQAPKSGTRDLPYLELKDSIAVTDIVRGQNNVAEMNIGDNDLVELVFDDNTTWLCPPDTLEDIYPGSFAPTRNREAVFVVPTDLDHPEASRGIFDKAVLKVINLFGRKAIKDEIIIHLAKDLEDKQTGKTKGLVRVNEFFELEKLEQGGINITSPIILFIHGTNSSTTGSFGELINSDLWNFIRRTYNKNNILAFQHETLTKSPIQNAVELAEQLPANADIHIITHSRGGLIGEILSRFNDSSGPDAGFSQQEIKFFRESGLENDAAQIEKLKEIYRNKKFHVTKFIRVACPASGTTILSKRLDHFFNISLNLIGLATGTSANPIYLAMKNLLTAIVDKKNNADVLPGLEAMKPDSPFITVLNNQSSQVSITEPVLAISGNCKMKLNLKALVIIASKLFFQEQNDLVVNTKSMYNGSKRLNKLQFFFDEGTDVDHFHYFKNKKTNEAILLALKSTGTSAITGFTEHFRGQTGEAERNAVLGLDGGEYSTDKPLGKRPIVILLPGTMGSNLSSSDHDRIWINYLRMLSGQLLNLSIGEPGIEPSSLIKTSYRKLGEMLKEQYDVFTYPFDWRNSLESSTKDFDKTIKDMLSLNQPIRIIGHSMGGVLVRDFMVYFPETWKKLNESDGFRMVFLGSPLKGSHRIVNVIFGEDDIINKLGKLDIVHSKRRLLEMFSQYPGLHSLLPLTTDTDNDFAKAATWKKLADAYGDTTWPIPVDNDLKNFGKYRDKVLAAMPSLDFSNAVYIAGQDKQTPCGYRVDKTIRGSELVLLSTGEGDQSVTWDLGIPQSMTDAGNVYYVNHSHGALSNAPDMFNGIKEILAKGQTSLFSKKRPAIRGDQKVFKKPETSDFDFSPEGVQKTILGVSDDEETGISELPVKVMVSHGDLKYATYPLLAGHFKNDSILYAEDRIDGLLSGLLKRQHSLGIYPGNVGEYEIVIAEKDNFPGAIIIGLGDMDDLTAFELTRSVATAVTKYLLDLNNRTKLKSQVQVKEPIGISSLIIGCGFGKLAIADSVSAILQGVINSNGKIRMIFGEGAKVMELVEFVELYEDASLSCFYLVNQMSKGSGGTLNVTPAGDTINRLNGALKKMNYDIGTGWWNRITVSQQKNEKKGTINGMRFSISTSAAREELSTIFTHTGIIDNLVESISTDFNWSEQKARAIFELLIPNNFKTRLKRHDNISWVVDEYTAGFPWELLQDNSKDAKPLCISAGMIRQLVVPDSRLNIEKVAGNSALVIGDPELNGFLTQLSGALNEAKAVVDLLREQKYVVNDLLRRSAGEIIPAIFGDYKIIHLAGHGVFDPDPEKDSGMVIGKNNYLTTAEIAQMSTTPELVFVNCCFLGKTNGVAEEYFQSRFKLAANIGTQLIKNGVKAVIAAGWAVDDTAALDFAKKFYEAMFAGKTFGDAVLQARQFIYDNHRSKNTWGAYQCYGDPFYKLINLQQGKADKPYVIAPQAEIDLSNLLSALKSGEVKTDAMSRLNAISEKVDKCGIRIPAITELEATILKELNNYPDAILKYEKLIASPEASFSIIAVEQYYNIKMKHLVSRLEKETATPALEKELDDVIAGHKALLSVHPTAERYSQLGSAWKRKIQYYANSKAGVLKAITESGKYYYMAYSQATGIEGKDGVYGYTNWLALETLLYIAGKYSRKWGKPYWNTAGQKIFSLPSLKDISRTLSEVRNNHLKRPPGFDYWERLTIANLSLGTWILSSIDAKGKNVKKMPSSHKVAEEYIAVWNIMGTIGNKKQEIEHLELLMKALAAITKEKALYKGLEELKERLAVEIKGPDDK